MRDLGRSMNARVRAPGTDEFDRMTRDDPDGPLQRILNSPAMRLSLPAFEITSGIFDPDHYSYHNTTRAVKRMKRPI